MLGSTADNLAADSPEGYWAFARPTPDSGPALGDDAADVVADLIGRATAKLANVADADVVATPIGGMRVRDWLPTRTFELVVHGLDVAAAAGVRVPPGAGGAVRGRRPGRPDRGGDRRRGIGAAGTDRPRRTASGDSPSCESP